MYLQRIEMTIEGREKLKNTDYRIMINFIQSSIFESINAF